jgi:hypothetical protein
MLNFNKSCLEKELNLFMYNNFVKCTIVVGNGLHVYTQIEWCQIKVILI